ncbi:MAG: DUF5691 domain-containing protein [Bacteroidota bacterium]
MVAAKIATTYLRRINHDELLRNLTLGTARQELPTTVAAWLAERDAVDPTAAPAEQLLAAYAIQERLRRLPLRPGTIPAISPPAPEEKGVAPPRLARALDLILEGPYGEVLPEALEVLENRQLLVPPSLLPALLTRAESQLAADVELALRMVRAGGNRADWLARYHPDWVVLSRQYDLATAWKKAITPADRLAILRRWRRQDPPAARTALGKLWSTLSPTNQESLLPALAVGLSAADRPWLRERLGPKRKGVRRALLALLLRSGEERAREELTEVAVTAFDREGRLGRVLTDARAKNILQAYGGTPKGTALAEYLPRIFPPTLLPDLLSLDLNEYWAGLPKRELAAAASAIREYAEPEVMITFFRFATIVNPAQLPLAIAAEITADLPQEAFLTVFHGLLDREQNVLHLGGVPRILALSRREAWSARITKAFVHQLVGTLREVRDLPYGLQKDLISHWKLAIPLLDVTTFSWLSTHLNALTERPDTFGKLATETLRTTHFRRVLRE